jgi:hypothetical protein
MWTQRQNEKGRDFDAFGRGQSFENATFAVARIVTTS